MKRGFLDRPGCRLYYEAAGSGPFLVFAHGLGGNHLSWWQQVPHFRDRYTCVTFAHRGFSPSSAPPGGPDPDEFAGDLAALTDHLGAPDVGIVAQSMGGWTALDTRSRSRRACARWCSPRRPARSRAPLRCSTTRSKCRTGSSAAAAAIAMQANNIHVAAGERMAREQPAAHFLYQEIDALSTVDKLALRGRWRRPARRPMRCAR